MACVFPGRCRPPEEHSLGACCPGLLWGRCVSPSHSLCLVGPSHCPGLILPPRISTIGSRQPLLGHHPTTSVMGLPHRLPRWLSSMPLAQLSPQLPSNRYRPNLFLSSLVPGLTHLSNQPFNLKQQIVPRLNHRKSPAPAPAHPRPSSWMNTAT